MAMVQTEWNLKCSRCDRSYSWEIRIDGCPECRKRGHVGLLCCQFSPTERPASLQNRKTQGMAVFADLLPPTGSADNIWLGAGNTPLVRSQKIGPELGIDNLYFKLEGVNPSGSFKDRYVAVSLGIAKNAGYERVVVSSTGNLGISVALYSKAYNMPCIVLFPDGTPSAMLEKASEHGANLLATSWDGRQTLFEYIASKAGWFPVGLFLNRSVQNPYGVEGYKTFAYELLADLGTAPDLVLFPCARGNGLYGAWKGFMESQEWGWCSKVPRMLGCQPVGADSLHVSIERSTKYAVELPPIKSIAFSTMETVAGDQTLEAIRQSNGSAHSASETEILEAVDQLSTEGISVEASSAIPVACLSYLSQYYQLDKNSVVVCVLTACQRNFNAKSCDSIFFQRIDPLEDQLDDYLRNQGIIN